MASHPDEGTRSLDASFLETVTIHNREYQQYSITNHVYLAPIDEDEIERLQIMHDVLSRVFDQRLIFPPVTRPRRILDAGYGTASWALEVAEQHPQCEVYRAAPEIARIMDDEYGVAEDELVLGVDINPWQPEERPNNLYLQIEDLNGGISFPPLNFDLVHSQMMATGIHANRWASYLQDMFRVTRGGGWCQMVELYFNVQSDNGSLTDAHALRQWSTRYLESHQGLKDLRVPLRLPTLMREAGFVNIEHRMLQLHTCAWSTDPRDNEIGAVNRANVQRFLSSLAIYPFTEILGMAAQDAHLLIAQARLEADNPAFKAYFPLYVCIGRKSRSQR